MKPQDFVREFNRMCNKYKSPSRDVDCAECPMHEKNCWPESIMDVYKPENFAVTYDIVSKWSDEHPCKTYQSEFLKLFPDAVMCADVLDICPSDLANLIGCEYYGCESAKCDDCRRKFWLKPIDESEE